VRALTLTQPWATLVITGRKRIETRGWATEHRGPIAIHAAAGWTADDRDFAADLIREGILPNRWLTTPRSIRPDVPLGAVLGVVTLYRIFATSIIPRAGEYASWLTPTEREYGDFSDGRYGWFLTDPRPFAEPIPARGALGLWQYDGPMPAPGAS
jgi:hypothetical protein